MQRGLLTESNVSDIITLVETLDIPYFEWRFSIRVQHLRSVLDRWLTSSIHEFLQKYLTQDLVSLLLERGREDNSNSVDGRNDVDRLVVSVVDGHDLSCTLSAACSVLGRLFELLLERKCTFERRGHSITLEQRDAVDESITFRTGSRDFCVIEFQGDTVFWLDRVSDP